MKSPRPIRLTCPHCGDVTEQDFMLKQFVCGICDRPFLPPHPLPSEAEVDALFRRHGGRFHGLRDDVATIPATGFYIFIEDMIRLVLRPALGSLLARVHAQASPVQARGRRRMLCRRAGVCEDLGRRPGASGG